MTQLMKCSLCKHEVLTLTPRTHLRKLVWSQTCNPSAGEAEVGWFLGHVHPHTRRHNDIKTQCQGRRGESEWPLSRGCCSVHQSQGREVKVNDSCPKGCVAQRFLTVFWKEANKKNMAPCAFEQNLWSLCPKCSCDLEGLLVLLMWSREPEAHPSRSLEASLEHVTCGQLSLSVNKQC